jgi:hypothetical protein
LLDLIHYFFPERSFRFTLRADFSL